MSIAAFQMYEPVRQRFIENHRFYVKQARVLLLSQFNDKETAADKAADEYLKRRSLTFHPDYHDEAEVYESANDEAILFYELLSGMHEDTRLMIIAGMYHQWDKNLRKWMDQEMMHWCGREARRSIWTADFTKICDLLTGISFDVTKVAGYKDLNAMRLIVNVFKHGNGPSLEDLKVAYPQFLRGTGADGCAPIFPIDYIDHSFLKVTDEHLELFSESILAFWRAVPEEIILNKSMTAPSWFMKAVRKDKQNKLITKS